MLQRINLVPQTPLSTKIKRITPLILGLTFVILLVYLYADFQYLGSRIKQLDEEINRMASRTQQSTALQTTIKQLADSVSARRQQQTELKAKIAVLSEQLRQKRSFSLVLASISQALPSSVKCDKITFQQNTGLMSGTALQYRELPELVEKLRNNRLFKGVTLQDIDRDAKNAQGRFAFTIALELQ